MANTIELILTVKDFASGALSKATAGLVNFTKVAVKAGLALASLAGSFSIKAFADFESAMTGVAKTVDATVQEFAVLEKQIRQLAQTIPATTTEIAGVAEAAGQLGIETESILGFTKTMIDLGNATNLSANQAATSLAKLANITGLPQDQFDRLGSTIVDLGNNLATTEAEIVEMARRLAGAGTVIGLTEAQILGLSGALSSVGIRAEAGGTAVSTAMIEITKAVKLGGDELENFAKVTGVSTEEFTRAFEEDAGGAIIDFIEGLGRVEAEGGNVFKVLEDLGLSEKRLRDALLRASGAGDLFRESMELGSKAWQENTALTEEAEKRYQTLTSQFKVTMNVLKDQAITIGEKLAPAFIVVLDAVREFAKGFTNVFLALPTIISAFIELVKGLFTDLFTDPKVFREFMDNFNALLGALIVNSLNFSKQFLDILFKVARFVFVPLEAAFAVVGDNIKFAWQIVVNTFVGVITTAILDIVNLANSVLPKAFEIDTTFLEGFLDGVKEEILEVPRTFDEAFRDIGKDALEGVKTIGDDVKAIGEGFKFVGETAKESFSGLADISEVQEFGQMIKDTFDGIDESTTGFTEKFADMGASLTEITTVTTMSLKEIWDAHIQDWLGAWDEGMAVFQELSQATWEQFKEGVGDAIAGAIVFGEDLGEAFKSLMKNIAKSVISALIQIGIQRLAQALIAKAIGVKEASSALGREAMKTHAGAFSSTVVIPIVGPALAPGVAAASTSAMLAGSAAAGAAGAAAGLGLGGQMHDGITNIPREGTFLLDQGERVLSADQNSDFTNFMENGNGGGGNIINIENFSLLPSGETIPDSLVNATSEQWFEIAQRALTALNELGAEGFTTTLQFREDNI